MNTQYYASYRSRLLPPSLCTNAESRSSDPSKDKAGTKVGTAVDSNVPLLYPPTYDECMSSNRPVVTRKDIYHEGWIDFNKNGKKDVFEDQSQPEDKRLDDLSAR